MDDGQQALAHPGGHGIEVRVPEPPRSIASLRAAWSSTQAGVSRIFVAVHGRLQGGSGRFGRSAPGGPVLDAARLTGFVNCFCRLLTIFAAVVQCRHVRTATRPSPPLQPAFAGGGRAAGDRARHPGRRYAPGAKAQRGRWRCASACRAAPMRGPSACWTEAGLVRTEKNRGVFVRDIPVDRAIEIVELRAAMGGRRRRLAEGMDRPAAPRSGAAWSRRWSRRCATRTRTATTAEPGLPRPTGRGWRQPQTGRDLPQAGQEIALFRRMNLADEAAAAGFGPGALGDPARHRHGSARHRRPRAVRPRHRGRTRHAGSDAGATAHPHCPPHP